MAIAIEEGVNFLPCAGKPLEKARSAGRVAIEEGVNHLSFVGKPLQKARSAGRGVCQLLDGSQLLLDLFVGSSNGLLKLCQLIDFSFQTV